MSKFLADDVVEFREDSELTGSIHMTWSDTELDLSTSDTTAVFIHSSLPDKILSPWFVQDRLAPGYVFVEFLLLEDGICLVHEDSLILRDRRFTLGEIVKRDASHPQSGRVMSVSMECVVEPICSVKDMSRRIPMAAQAHHSIHRSPMGIAPVSRPELHGFPDNEQAEPLLSSKRTKLSVSAKELRRYRDFSEGDYVSYERSIGYVTHVHEEVTVRLSNGSVVTVEKAKELRVSKYVPGTASYELVQRLERAGYFKYLPTSHDEPKVLAECYHPGQYVRTAKGNLRRGTWIFGAYDPNVEPQGMVVDVRIIELQVDIVYSDGVQPDVHSLETPRNSMIFYAEDLERGLVKLIDKSRLPAFPLTKALRNATNTFEKDYGEVVRLTDTALMSLESTQQWSGIPRYGTQGYDMNVFFVVSTQYTALIHWQDGSVSEEAAKSLIRMSDIDEHELWPGDKVFVKVDEISLLSEPATDNSVSLAHRFGVIQTIDAAERLAKVRWFNDVTTEPFFPPGTFSCRPRRHGAITDEISEVSLYDVATYKLCEPCLGDFVATLPDCRQSLLQVDDYYGEIVELCLDGDIILRCYNADEPHDNKINSSYVLVVHRMSYDESDDEDDYDVDDDVDADDIDMERVLEEIVGDEFDSNMPSPEPMDVQIEYQGGNRVDNDGNESDWSTEGEMPMSTGSLSDGSSPEEKSIQPTTDSGDEECFDAKNKDEMHLTSNDAAQSPVPRSVKPPSFDIINGAPPHDHRFCDDQYVSNANMAKGVMKQHKIMMKGLPEGVFVRTWDARLDVLRILIIGPVGTPYENSPFFFDMQLPTSFPEQPPDVYFHSWTNNAGRINPNLYEDGKVCLSLLGTWPADEKSQEWSKNSTILQILVSILGLILVREPYYNETGFEVLIGSDTAAIASRTYSEKAFITSKSFLKTALFKPPSGFEDILEWLYCAPSGPQLLRWTIQKADKSTSEPSRTLHGGDPEATSRVAQDNAGGKSWAETTGKLSAGAQVFLDRHIRWLIDFERTRCHQTAAKREASLDNKKKHAINQDEEI